MKTLSVLQNMTFLAKEIEKVYSGFFKKRLGLSDRMILDYCRATEASI